MVKPQLKPMDVWKFTRNHFRAIAVVAILLVVGYGTMFAVTPDQREHRIAIRIKSLGGNFGTDQVGPDGTPEWVQETIPCSERIRAIFLFDQSLPNDLISDFKSLTYLKQLFIQNCQLSESGWNQLEAVPQLNWLNLNETNITDQGLEHVKGLSRLEVLILSGSQVTDAGLSCLKELTRLEKLYLRNTSISDASLDSLCEMKSLRWLEVNNTQVTEAGRAKLRERLPECRVFPEDRNEKQVTIDIDNWSRVRSQY